MDALIVISPSLSTAAERIRDAAAGALSWLIPVECAGCGEPDRALCPACDDTLRRSRPRHRALPGVDVVSAMEYTGPVVGVMRSLKSEGRTGLARPLGMALRTALEQISPGTPGLIPCAAGAAWVPVGIPSSAAAFRRRGYRVVDLIARHAGLRCVPVLRVATAAADQRALGRAERHQNAEGMFTVRSLPRAPLILVDDVVTTGATLRAAAHAIRAAGGTVVGAVTVASTPLRWVPPDTGAPRDDGSGSPPPARARRP